MDSMSLKKKQKHKDKLTRKENLAKGHEYLQTHGSIKMALKWFLQISNRCSHS